MNASYNTTLNASAGNFQEVTVTTYFGYQFKVIFNQFYVRSRIICSRLSTITSKLFNEILRTHELEHVYMRAEVNSKPV